MIFKLFQLHKISLISFYCYRIYKASSFNNMRVDLANKQYNSFIKHHTNKRNPDFFHLKKKYIEGLQKNHCRNYVSQQWQWCNTLSSQMGLSCFLYKRLLLYLSNINSMNIKGWLELIAFNVDGRCCIITLISSWK